MKYRHLRKNGYALLSIIIIGALSIIFLMALSSMVINSVRVVSANRWVESLRNAAEIGIDYAINQYNMVTPCPLDPAANQTSQTTNLPPQFLESLPATSGAPGVSVSIKVTQILSLSDWTTLQSMSSIYSAQFDPNFAPNQAQTFANPMTNLPPNVSGGAMRIVESTATNGIYSRTIRVILKGSPSLNRPDGKNPLVPSNGSYANQSYFSAPLFANQGLQIIPTSGPLLVQGYNSGSQQLNTFHTVSPQASASYAAYDLSLQTNQQAAIGTAGGSSATIAGDLNVSSNQPGSNTVVSIPNGTIDGRVTTNGNINPANVTYTANAGQPSPGDTVLANADLMNGSTSRQGSNFAQPEQLNSPLANQNQTAAASPPVGATTLGLLSSVSEPLTGGSVFESAGLTTTGVTTPVVVQNSGSPVTFYVDDSNTNTAININTSQFVTQNTDARNLQIFYQGSDQVNVNVSNGGTFTGLIYAPNAPINITGNGTFNGAMVGNSVNVSMSGIMNIYTDLNATSGASGKLNSAPGVNVQYLAVVDPVTGKPTAMVIQSWQPITWQEYNSGG